MACENWHLGRILLSAAPNLLSLYNGHFFSKSRVCICKHFVNKLPSPAVRRCNSFCFYGIAAAMGLRHTNGNIGVTIATFNQSVFLSPYPYFNFKSAFWPVLQKTIEINRLTLSSPLLRPDLGSWQSETQKMDKTFALPNLHKQSPHLYSILIRRECPLSALKISGCII